MVFAAVAVVAVVGLAVAVVLLVCSFYHLGFVLVVVLALIIFSCHFL